MVFVRHALPGERVLAALTEAGETASHWRADAVEVLEASPDRVDPPCPWAGPGRCGGCDWQHAALPAQRLLKAAVVSEQLARLAGLDVSVVVEPVPGDDAGLGWRTRVDWAVDATGRAGLRRHRSHEVVAVDTCRIATPDLDAIGVTAARWPGVAHVQAVASGAGDRAVVVTPRAGRRPRLPRLDAEVSVLVAAGPRVERVRGRTRVGESAAGRSWQVSAAGFWQVHPGSADTLVAAVLDAAKPQSGETALDLYSGVGLLAAALADRVGASGSVVAVEDDRRAAADARRCLHDLPQVRLVESHVDRALASVPGLVDLVVLDPPRSGAARRVVEQIAERRPRAIVYVACDPAALARDVATFGGLGYGLDGLRAFDLFPMTHHVECVAVLRPARAVPPERSRSVSRAGVPRPG